MVFYSTVRYQLLNAANYGVPQRRERVIIIGIRHDIQGNYNYPLPTHSEDNWVALSKVVPVLAIPEKNIIFPNVLFKE